MCGERRGGCGQGLVEEECAYESSFMVLGMGGEISDVDGCE